MPDQNCEILSSYEIERFAGPWSQQAEQHEESLWDSLLAAFRAGFNEVPKQEDGHDQ